MGIRSHNIHGDDENKPNQFKIGDFVTVIDDETIPKNQVCVVWHTPVRNNPKVYFENTYCIATISEENRLEFYHEHNESRLRKYEGKMNEDSPLFLLQAIYTNQIKISQETMRKIELGEILLNTKPSWREIKELKRGIKFER